jgi:hypothetical protein
VALLQTNEVSTDPRPPLQRVAVADLPPPAFAVSVSLRHPHRQDDPQHESMKAECAIGFLSRNTVPLPSHTHAPRTQHKHTRMDSPLSRLPNLPQDNAFSVAHQPPRHVFVDKVSTQISSLMLRQLFEPFGSVLRTDVSPPAQSQPPPLTLVGSIEYREHISAAMAAQGMDRFTVFESEQPMRVLMDPHGEPSLILQRADKSALESGDSRSACSRM